jgi:hypothetical protein
MSILQRRFNPREHAVKTDLYVSDFEQFLNWLKNDHPELGREQMLSRALRWDNFRSCRILAMSPGRKAS